MVYYAPILLIVAANTLYHVAAKGMPDPGNSFAPLVWTYLTATLLTIVMFFVTGSSNDLVAQMKNTNLMPFIFGASLVALEFGYVLLYKMGWNISIGSTFANIALAVVMLIVGILFYKEQLSIYQVAGIILCGVGLFLINKK